MKKSIAYSFCLLATLLLAACGQEEPLSSMQESETVRITLAAEQREARAASDIELKRYVVEAYTTDGQPANIFAGNTTHHLQQSVPTFTLQLDRTKQYRLLFWADCEEETTAAYNVANLKQVTVVDGKKANANAF